MDIMLQSACEDVIKSIVFKALHGTTCFLQVFVCPIFVKHVVSIVRLACSAMSIAIKTRMPSGKQYFQKKVELIARERFHHDNILYKQLFIDYLSAKIPCRIKFFYESGLKLSNVEQDFTGILQLGSDL